MSSEKQNTGKHEPQPDWKLEVDKQWRQFSGKANDFYNDHKHLFSMSKVASMLGGTLVVAWLGSGFYIVGEGNRGVVARFGAYADTTLPGPHWHFPLPIEEVTIVNVEQQRFIEIGYRDSSRLSKSSLIPAESLMLTADENIINVRLAVQYQVNNAKNYLYSVKDNENTLKQVTESVERAVIGRNNMDFVLTEGRSQIVAELKEQIQQAMDDYRTGITIASVNLQDAQPPEEVQGAFEDAIRAREDKQRLINEAEAYSNEIIPKARGAASRIIQEAEAYEAEKLAKAKGETERFDQLLVEYEKNPAITRKRLYLEAKEKLYSSTNKIMLGADGANPMLYMPLPQTVSHPASSATTGGVEAEHNIEPSAKDKNAARKSSGGDLRPSRSKP
ncbi:FtsH protease activity modulator HflK [Methylomonas sp. UP202]|uniref:FtsH protease activity modulator HflK n=1 Tax=Methylomonas sp. UP202 TaxID=3040943 RepID=UPI002478BC42|nr:FtsH protease activity modulator HflK [Methylomonas sp. UP202]WGS87774.1 FtsH protease activity modulator HflK [Methylomonas sp. UP202]